ncbi:hypothetical protein [Bacteriovorax sp. DB6_IX]|uniref:hypothetical protein n=1 Tax=Bacteriovorax sp. DB6_IX TaxID=1353530 RepID=UPI00038A5012|nr:hypothetical protein [Bacteriovorax sp. DB6_IX]EQC50525.1 hypothetical protein M901_1589 [Bacteriovorax sp. DB6_IX]
MLLRFSLLFALILSLLVHVLIIFKTRISLNQNFNNKKLVNVAKRSSRVKIKRYQRPSNKRKKVSRLNSRLNSRRREIWQGLDFSHARGELKNFEQEDSSKHYKVVELIDEQLVYPSEFSEIGLEGIVEIKIVIDRKGQFDESLSYFSSKSKYLEIYMRRLLRKCLRDNRILTKKDTGVVELIVEFDLTTELRKDNHGLSHSKYLYRQAYGGKTPVERGGKVLTEVLGAVMNPLVLLKHLPSIKAAQRRRLLKKLRSYQRDSYW